jgi:hypothetical protein
LEQTEIFVKAVVEAAGDEEATDRIRAARDTYTKGTPTTGWPRLAEMLGEPIIDRLRDWLGVRGGKGEEWPEPGHIAQELLPVPTPRFYCPRVCVVGSRTKRKPCPVRSNSLPYRRS